MESSVTNMLLKDMKSDSGFVKAKACFLIAAILLGAFKLGMMFASLMKFLQRQYLR